MFRCPATKFQESPVPTTESNGSKDMQPLRSTSSLHLTRVQAKESSQSLWKARSWRFGSRYVRPRSLSTGNGEVAVVLSLPETNSWHLKMDGWNMIVSLLGMAYFQRPTVSFIKSVYQHQQFERREQKWKNTDEKQTLNWIAKHFECHQFHQCHFIVLELW